MNAKQKDRNEAISHEIVLLYVAYMYLYKNISAWSANVAIA